MLKEIHVRMIITFIQFNTQLIIRDILHCNLIISLICLQCTQQYIYYNFSIASNFTWTMPQLILLISIINLLTSLLLLLYIHIKTFLPKINTFNETSYLQDLFCSIHLLNPTRNLPPSDDIACIFSLRDHFGKQKVLGNKNVLLK